MGRTTDGAGWDGQVALLPVGGGPLLGTVTSFDEPRGLGVVEVDDGRRVAFHCTAITDGTRTIPVGAAVACTLGPGHLGQLEAVTVRPLPG